MSYGLAFGFPRNNTLAAAASPFAQLGPTLDLVFTGVGSSGDPTANDSLDLNFVGDTYSVAAPYMVWGGTGMTAENFQDIVTFSRATGNATYYNSSGYLTTAGVWNYLTYSNVFDNAAWTKTNSFIQTNLLLRSEQFDGGAWSKGVAVTITPNAAIAPDGTLTADRFVSTGGAYPQMSQTLTLSAGNYTGSIWVLSDGTPQIEQSIILDGTPQAFTPTSTWTRITVTKTGITAGSRALVIATNSGAAPASSFYIWGAQLVEGSVPGNYQATVLTAQPVLYPDYNGALRARKLSESTATAAHYIFQGNIAAGTYTLSVYAKQGERTRFAIGNSNAGDYAYFDLATGVVTNTGSGTTSNGTITNIGNGWYRCSVVCTVGVTWPAGVLVLDAVGSITYTGDGSSGIYIADAQLNDGSSALPYYDTTQYPYNAPRFDYDPVTLAAKGLLVEELRANLATFSNTFSDASWTARSAKNLVASTVLSPEGVANAWTLTDSSAVAFEGIEKVVTVAADGATYTGSIYILKTAGGTSSTFGINFQIIGGTTVSNQPRINTDTGAVLNGTATVTNAGLWWRVSCSVTNNSSVGNTNLAMQLYPATAAYNSGADTVAATGSATIYGAQIETGAFASSYIPTVGSQLTRAADVASVNTLSPWFNQAGGTIYVEALHGAIPSAAAMAVEIGDGTNNNRHAVFTVGGASCNYYNFVGGVSQATISAPAFAANVVGKFAVGYAVNDFQTVGNGTLGGADTSGSLPTNLNKMFIGNNVGTASFWGGWLRRITYYPRRLTNAELQTLTT